MLRKMVIPGERIEEAEGSEHFDDSDTDSVCDICFGRRYW